ncbi:hypothetical protein SAMN04488243_101131 [Thermus arciformis]|uniref:HNH nuclease domain-containing protein n=1 Tax=Thermus arciformis TaxID=482827 RepID=A0A1G7CTM4_9DEIN|nr:DUF262 domain-containing protein [Thermus arciformis]SDE41845.1 hypothetical protein SAMN04488243_101131 [Thermus arciformis]
MNQLLKKVRLNQFKLPQFQRDFVWNEAQVALLIDSIARNYPIGSLLLLEPSPEIRLSTRPLQVAVDDSESTLGNSLSENPPEDEDTPTEGQELLILDGQQRMTSIVRVLLNAHPQKTYWFDLQALYSSFEDERSDWIKKTSFAGVKDPTRNNGRWVRADLVTEGEEQKHVIDYFLGFFKEERDKAMKAIQKVNRIFETIRNYEVPYILLDGQEGIEAICRIFETINSTGTRLTTFDLAVARYFPEPDLRNLYERARSSHNLLKRFDIDGERILQIIVLIEKNTEPSRSEQLKLRKEDINKNWDKAVSALVSAIKWAQSECGLEPRYYVGESQLVALAGALADLEPKKQQAFLVEKRDKLVQWFFANVLQSGFRATNYRIFIHYKSLQKLLEEGQIPEDDLPEVKLDLESLINLAKSDNRYKAIQALLRRVIPEDFYSGSRIESDVLEIHHIFPRSFGGKKKVDSIANLVPLTSESNQLLSNRNPSDYIRDLKDRMGINVANHRLRNALLPIQFTPGGEINPLILSDDQYETFLRERGKLILEKIKEVLGNRLAENPPDD